MLLNIEGEFFSLSLYTGRHLLLNRYRGASGLSQISKMEFSTNTGNGLKPLAISLNNSTLDVSVSSKYTFEVCFSRVSFNKID